VETQTNITDFNAVDYNKGYRDGKETFEEEYENELPNLAEMQETAQAEGSAYSPRERASFQMWGEDIPSQWYRMGILAGWMEAFTRTQQALYPNAFTPPMEEVKQELVSYHLPACLASPVGSDSWPMDM
jgi:hypothetical protein